MSQGEIFLTEKLKECIWHAPEEPQSAPRTRGGGGQVIVYGAAFWRLTCRYENLNEVDYRELDAWLNRRRGAKATFVAHRPSLRYPKLAPSMSNTGLGIGTINIGASTVQVTGVGGAQISKGDMLSYVTAANGYYVGQATAAASPSGGSVVIPVYPTPKTKHASPFPRLVEALGEFQLAGAPQKSEPHSKRFNVSFDAIQVLR